MKKNTLLLVLSLTLILGIVVGGTIAWLKDSTEEVINTFTVGDINIDLEEHPLKTGDDYDGKTIDTSKPTVKAEDKYKMLPGRVLQKDPFVTVKANSEACWLFVKVEKSDNFDTYMTYEIADGWTAVPGQTGVYYRQVAATTADSDPIYILKNNQITVKSEVTKTQLESAATSKPTLKFTAYAVQQEGLNAVADAWTAASAA